jgi:hypothetical protein
MRWIGASLAVILSVLLAPVALAQTCCDPAKEQCGDPSCCPRCGCKKVCKLVCEIKEVKKIVWTVQCEDFCTTLPGCGHACRPCAGGEAECTTCAHGSEKVCQQPCLVPPKCGHVHSKKILIPKEVTCKVLTYKCVPVCPSTECCSSGSSAGTPGAASAPAPAPPPAPRALSGQSAK